MTVTSDNAMRAEAERLLDEAIELSRDYGNEVAEAVREASDHPLDVETATRVYTRILTMLRIRSRDLDETQQQALADDVRAEVARFVGSVGPRPQTAQGIQPEMVRFPDPLVKLVLVERNGLKPHVVSPVPIFNNMPIPMTEGYVDVNTLPLWRENHRVEFYVEEFAQLNKRQPDSVELLAILHGTLVDMPSLRAKGRQTFGIEDLADSIARKGVQQPPIVTWGGEPKDGNRRISAAKYILTSDRFTAEQKERARWVRVWRAPRETTDDQFEAIVVSLNFESDHKEEWPEYVKGRLVAARYRQLREDLGGIPTDAQQKKLRAEVATTFAIKTNEVLRYVRMVQWAEDYEAYHVEERGLNPAAVRHRTNRDFQRFYEIQAGKSGTKLTEQLERDDALRPVIYDLMYDVLDSGVQVRELHNVVADETALKLLRDAHEQLGHVDVDQVRSLVEEAIGEAKRKSPTKRIGLELWLRGAADRLSHTTHEDWQRIDTGLLIELRRVIPSAVGAIDGELVARGLMVFDSGEESG